MGQLEKDNVYDDPQMVIISGWFMVLGLPHCMSFTIRETGFANKVWRLWEDMAECDIMTLIGQF